MESNSLNETKYRDFISHILENVPCGCCQCTADGENPIIISANEKACEIAGFSGSASDAKGKKLYRFLYEYDRERMQQQVNEQLLFGRKQSFEVRIVRKDSKLRWLSCNIERMTGPDEKNVLFLSFVDITEMVEYQKQLENLTETAGSGIAKICFHSKGLELQYANNSFYQMWSTEVISKGSFFDIKCYIRYIQKPLFGSDAEPPKKIEFEYPFVMENGDIRYIYARGDYLTREQARPVYVFLFHDITKIHRADEEQRGIMKHIPGGVVKFRIDEDFTLVNVNSFFYDYFHTNEERLSEGGMKFIYEPDREKVRQFVDGKASMKDDFNLVFRIMCGQDVKWIHLYGVFLEMSDSCAIYQCLIIECTKQEELRIALEKEKERYQTALTNAAGILFEYCSRTDELIYFKPTGDYDAEHSLEKKIDNFSRKVRYGNLVREKDRDYLYRICKNNEEMKIQGLQLRINWQNHVGEKQILWFEVQGSVTKDNTDGYVKIIGITKDITNEKKREKEQEEGLQYDSLTKLYNRDSLAKLMDNRLTEHKSQCAFLMITIEDFMLVNDRYGHMFGDAVLKEIAGSIRQIFDENQVVGRLGGVEFGVFATDLSQEMLIGSAEKICQCIHNIYVGEDEKVSIFCKIGIVYAGENDDFQKLLDRARKVVFRLKYEEGNNYGFEAETGINLKHVSNSESFFNYNPDEVSDYLEEDIVTFAFNVLERTKDAKSAIVMLLQRIVKQYRMERASIVEINARDGIILYKYQWASSVNMLTRGEAVSFRKEELIYLLNAFEKESFLEAKPDEYLPFSRIFREGNYAQDVYLCPVFEEGNCNGYVLFERFSAADVLYENEKTELVELVKIISSYLSKLRADEASRTKGEFLSRMSHEIRTPMNAICGMTDLLMQNNLTGLNKDYVQTIKKASDNLLGIINDILDFSKIEAGKLEIIKDEYEVKNLVEELMAIIPSELVEKGISFYTTINPNIPKGLYGDEARIRQIGVNLITNAAKYTEEGFVELEVDYEKLPSPDKLLLKISVKDSGIGIRKNDVDKLFAEFQQVDTKRNRKVEGTGLGLSISRQLAELMHGNIAVESEYGKGSVFTLSVEQEVTMRQPAVKVNRVENISVLVYEKDEFHEHSLREIFRQMNINAFFSPNKDKFLLELQKGTYTHVFYDYDKMFYDIQKMLESMTKTEFISMMNFKSYQPREIDNRNHHFIHKPLTVFSIDELFEGQQEYASAERIQQFIAPTARLLIVDDNKVNLKVAIGLLQSYQCTIDTAISGFDAINMIMKNPVYDILFIDHMMPKMDGVETLQLIRRNCGEYGKKVVAVALTANALKEAQQMFIDNSFQDFLAKPIVLKLMHQIMNRWIPVDKKQMFNENQADLKNNVRVIEIPGRIRIKGVETLSGMNCCGNRISAYLYMMRVIYEHTCAYIENFRESAKAGDDKKCYASAEALRGVMENIGATKQLKMTEQFLDTRKKKNAEFMLTECDKLYNAYRYLLNQIEKMLQNDENDVILEAFQNKERILVVDDSPTSLTMTEQCLYGEYETLSATSGKAALNFLQFYKPDLIILDVEMKQMDGLETMKKIRAVTGFEYTPVILLSVIRDGKVISEGYKTGIADYVKKPFKRREILEKINFALRTN